MPGVPFIWSCSSGGLCGNGTSDNDLTNDGGRLIPGDAFGGGPYSRLRVTGNFSVTEGDSVFVSYVGRDTS